MRLGFKIFVAVLGSAFLSLAVLALSSSRYGTLPPTTVLVAIVLVAGVISWVATRLVMSAVEERVLQTESETQRLEAVVDGMSEGVLVTDSDGKVSWINPQWRELFGVSGEVEGESVLDLSHRTALKRMLVSTLEDRTRAQLELELAGTGSGTPRTLILKSAPLIETGGAVVVAEDVTELLRLTEIRSDFVANVSHELKTPLSAIRGFAETLADGAKDDPKTSKRFLKRILKQCTRLEALLSDLLTLSRLEHSEDQVRAASVEMGSVVAEALEDVVERVAKKELVLETDLQPVPRVAGDAVALERLCTNLLANAVKYNRPGGTIQVRLLPSRGDVVLEVEDTGIGIPAESIDRLFERFYRVDKGRSRKEGGTGLGLAIVKHAANLHGGIVEVESELGRGSLFRVRIPGR